MFDLPDSWVWDFWFADDGDQFHLFFLFASRALVDPHRRHGRASVGHAVSADLRTWTRVTDALVRDDAPAADDAATWTGSVIGAPDGGWLMFYTGLSNTDSGWVQRVMLATSRDLYRWHKRGVVLTADPDQHEVVGAGRDEAFRDPWVRASPDGKGWEMFVTARAATGPVDDRGVIARAWSPDLDSWLHRPPLTEPGHGFGQLEVPQLETIEGRDIVLFSCLPEDLSAGHRASGVDSGTWWVEAVDGRVDVSAARPLTDRSRYSGRVIRDRDGTWRYLAFAHDLPDGTFGGWIDDPRPIGWDGDTLVLR